jgi:hypothetical protein
MGWFRPRVRFGAWLALAALALNLAFAFGHHHIADARSPAAAQHAGVTGHTDDDDDHSSTVGHPCFTCAVESVAAFAANPPTLPARAWTRTAGITTTTAFGLQQSNRAGFEARAPPHA